MNDAPPTDSPDPAPPAGDPAYAGSDYEAAVTDLVGVLAYGALSACVRLAGDADLAPTLGVTAAMARLAMAEYEQYAELAAVLRERGVDPESAMAPFVAPFAGYHERTKASTWLEALVKAHVGDGVAKDFYAEMAALVDDRTRAAIAPVAGERATSDFVVPLVRAAIGADPSAVGRLSLWGRRLLGEAMSQAQAVAVERDSLTNLLVGADADVAVVGEMFTRLQQRHLARMAELGLSG